jgi:hypothetical protein
MRFGRVANGTRILLVAMLISLAPPQVCALGPQPTGRGAPPAALDGSGSGPPPPVASAGTFGHPTPPLSPPAVVQPILHQHDPAPHLPAGFAMSYVGGEQIDGAGNILIQAILEGPEVTDANNLIDYYATADDTQVLMWESQQAPDMPAGVVISYLLLASECLAENGTVALVPAVSGPGIVPGYNDYVLYAGYPGALQKVLQGGDQAPGCEPGVYIDVSQPGYFLCFVSDNGTLRVEARVAGPGVSSLNDSAVWIGPPDDLALVYRDGMPAPGCAVGVTFAYGDLFVHNDFGQVSFRGGLRGTGVTSANDQGLWFGTAGALMRLAREGDPAPFMPAGVTWKTAGGTPDMSVTGYTGECSYIQGPGVTEINDFAFYFCDDEGLFLLQREGDPAVEVGPEVTLTPTGSWLVNNRNELFCSVKYAGAGVSTTNRWAMYFGPLADLHQTLRDSDPAPTFICGTTLWRINGVPTLGGMNDVGDVVAPTQIQGASVTDADKVVLWMRHHVLQRWVPLLRSGSGIDGRTLYAADETAFDCGATGGADGRHQKLNDSAMLAMRLEFADGTHGIYRLCFPFGDGNHDGRVDPVDWVLMHTCWTGLDGALGRDCEFFDLDADGDVDLADQALFQQLYQGG